MDAHSKKHIKIGIVLTYLTMIISALGSLFITPIVLNNVGDSNYGLLSFSTSITSWISIITTAFSSSFLFFINKEIKENKTEYRTPSLYFKVFRYLSYTSFTLLVVIIGTLFLTKVKFSSYSLEETQIILILLLISGCTLCITMFFNAFNQYLVYKKEFIFLRTVTLVITVLIYALNVVIAVTTKNIILISCVSLGTTFINFVSIFLFAIFFKKMKITKISLKDNFPILKEILIYSSLILINAISINIHGNVDKTVLGFMAGSEFVAFYTLSTTFTDHLFTLSNTISETTAPVIYERYKNNDNEGVNELFLKVSKTQLLLTCLVVGGFAACGYYFIKLWLGEGRIQVFYYSLALMVLDIYTLSNLSGIVCARALNKQKYPTFSSLIAAVTNLGLSILFVFLFDKSFSVWSCIFATILTKVALNYVVLPLYYKRKCGLSIGKSFLQYLKFISFALFGVGISYLTLYFIQQNVEIANIYLFLISGSIFAIIYVFAILIFERKFLFKLFKKR